MPDPQATSVVPPGVLYYDPNPTTAKLATATLRLAGYEVYACDSLDGAVAACNSYGPSGSGSIVALVLDAAADPRLCSAVLKALLQVPGTSELPGILLVSKRNPTPIPGAEDLPTVRRPFSSPALLKVVHETVAAAASGRVPVMKTDPVLGQRAAKLGEILQRHGAILSDASVAALLADLEAAEELPKPAGDETLRASLGSPRLEAVLEMLGSSGATGVLTVESADRVGMLHLDKGRIRLGEYRGQDEDLKLGRFVVEGGFMRDEELETFIIGRDPEGRPLGTRLVDGGFLTLDTLAAVLCAQAREVACHLLTLRDGVVTYRPNPTLHPLAAAAAGHGTELLIDECLLDGLRRLDEAAMMGPHMPDVEDVYIRIDEQVARTGRESLSRDDLGVLELINGRNPVKEIARRTRAGSFAVATTLYRLGKAGMVRRRVMPVTV